MLLLILALLAVPMLALIPHGAEGGRYSATVAKDDHDRYFLYGSANDTYEITFKVTTGSNADIYIMTEYWYDKYWWLKYFFCYFNR